MPATSAETSAPARKRFRLQVIPFDGLPYWYGPTLGLETLVKATRVAEAAIKDKSAKIITIFKDENAVRLLVHRPRTYVHIERV